MHRGNPRGLAFYEHGFLRRCQQQKRKVREVHPAFCMQLAHQNGDIIELRDSGIPVILSAYSRLGARRVHLLVAVHQALVTV